MSSPVRTALFTILLAGCGGGSIPPADAPSYPTRVVAPSALPGDWVLEQEVTITHAEGENGFRAVLQKRADELVLLGIGPHGGRAFALTQTGTRFLWEAFVPIELPFPPQFMLYDVHRTWLQPSTPPASGTGEHVVSRDGERVVELWRDGALVQRSFERLDGRPAGRVTVRYPGGLSAQAPASVSPPDEATLDNGWHGYRAHVRTLRWTPLPIED